MKQKDSWGETEGQTQHSWETCEMGSVCQEEPLLSLSAYPQQKEILCSLLAGPITHIEAPVVAPRVFWLPRLPKPCSYLLSSKPARTIPIHPHPSTLLSTFDEVSL